VSSWIRPAKVAEHRRIADDRKVYFVSDLHMGDGSRSDSFLGKDREFMAFLEQVRDEKARLVIAGDAIDFHQAWSMSRVLRAHARVMGELARMADQQGVIYLWGNHDHDISLYKELLRFEVLESLEIGDQVLVQHGYQYDPYIGPLLEQSHTLTRIHHLVERVGSTWLRLPLQNFYNLPNRAAFWTFHRLFRVLDALAAAAEAAGVDGPRRKLRASAHYWAQCQLGDSQCIFDDARRALQTGPHRWLVTGHSHLPGIVEVAPERWYTNTGSWTFHSAQYAIWDGSRMEVRDWLSGRSFGDESYRPLMERRIQHLDLDDWWRDNYLGGLRFRVGEERRGAAGDLPDSRPGVVAAPPVA
jgi:UDP-2,3-diacylglucosamine pyrophosphatase LpxH